MEKLASYIMRNPSQKISYCQGNQLLLQNHPTLNPFYSYI